MLSNEELLKEKDANIVVRVLNGFLRGCEFTLSEGRTIFIVDDKKHINEQHKGTVLPDNSIYIPAENVGVNFEISVVPDKICRVFLREIHDDDELSREIVANEVIVVGLLKFAWRHQQDIFLNEILSTNIDGSGVETLPTETTQTPHAMGRLIKICVVGIVLSILLVTGYIYQTASQREINSVAALLNYAPEDYQIIFGHDRQLYVFAKTDKAAEWAIQTLIRNPPRQQAHVVSKDTEQQRVARWIESHWPQVKFHRIKLTSARNAVIQISAERTSLSERDRDNFSAALKHAFSYMDAVILESLNDTTVRNIAVQGLQKMALPFREVSNGDSVTFVIYGVIEDGMLESIKNFINQYYQLWGGRYVHFSLELQTDWFKDKSFKFGELSYIKLSSGHWFFPLTPQKEK
ncbi:PrgH/EprH family type III secretion apparatus protein [Yersinia kristensenii]|uniref:PrgH/EprH family type III secretion apparatus protein n=1 Tax=Yersinia kristensenii TaxID=28152 RepID=UPI0005E37875|nr:PrgH/EprH family type III secretion apparatus protein [Yersinia kristensenii]CNF34317.1 type III secretion system needle complex protein PrgH [Yersinia kristensenii]